MEANEEQKEEVQEEEKEEQKELEPVSFSILGLQTLIYFEDLFVTIFFVLMVAVYIYKSSIMLYAPNAFECEMAGLVFFYLMERLRLFIGSVANKTEGATPVLWFIILLLPAIWAGIYLILLQTYVENINRFLVDIVLTGMLLVFEFFQLIFGILTFLKYKAAAKT